MMGVEERARVVVDAPTPSTLPWTSDMAGTALLGCINLGGEGRYRRTQVPCSSTPVLASVLAYD